MERNDLIAVICYNTIEFWKSRKKAINFYREGMRYCDGCEAERYGNIVNELLDESVVVFDEPHTYQEAIDHFNLLIREDRITVFQNGTNIRDVDGKISYPMTKDYKLVQGFVK